MVQAGAKVTHSAQEAARFVASGTPVVLVQETSGHSPGPHLPELPAEVALPACDPPGLIAVMAGPGGPELAAAAAEMAGELFVWATQAEM